MEPVRLTVPGEGGGIRLDSFLAASLPELTRSAAARQADAMFVTIRYLQFRRGSRETVPGLLLAMAFCRASRARGSPARSSSN